MNHKYIQPQNFQVNALKFSAITLVENYVNEHLSDYKNGEIISIEYLTENGEKATANVVVLINNETAKLHAQISDNDTIKIVEKPGTTPPADEKSMWLSDNWDDEVSEDFPADNLKDTIKNMSQRILFLEQCLESLIITKTLGGGDIITQSKKYELENQSVPLMPENAQYPYTTGSTIIKNWDMLIGGSPVSSFAEGGLYVDEKYYLKPYATNEQGEPIDPSALTLTAIISAGDATIDENNVLTSTVSGHPEITYVIQDNNHPEWSADTKTQLVTIDDNEKPNYNLFNVEHLLVKKVETRELLDENIDYILVGEFVWCVEEEALYLKEKSKNGTIQLFKINGNGSITPSGDTEIITYAITDEGILNANSSEGSIFVDEEGVLNLIGTLTEDGVLLLNDAQIPIDQ